MFFHISVAEYKIRYLCMAFSDLCKTAKATFRLKKTRLKQNAKNPDVNQIQYFMSFHFR